ncbi:DUF4097 domain-containing protein [Pseudonocardia sp. EV170527-09]|uniref:DUF4097 family beta strand repeat-containing protein n=1 Tax=Pseudonocardia sp. EV170527-09 TaxID=2603411 RepID=UPI0011F11167|nr:DUF4097 family beta strand repeat-containing protein [Pseudonocardia sp. EV170527-09]KAA1030715.1 DUF4097 domain-containing protein [Pseudonocardia sp. EV170527-09]
MSDEQTGPVGPDDASADATHGGGAHTEGTGATGARSGDAGHPPTAGADPGGASTGDAGTGTPSRSERFDCAGAAEIEVTTGAGRVRIDLVEGADEVRAEITADRSAAPWSGGLGGLLDWIGSSMTGRAGVPQAGAGWSGRGFDPIVGAPWEATGDPSADAVDAVTVEWSAAARRLVVRGPDDAALGAVPLVVTISAPAGSRPAVRTGAASVELTGRASWAAVRTGSGAARLAEVHGDTDVTTGAGSIALGRCSGRAHLRAGSGGVEAGSLGGASRIRTGSGDIRVGELTADLEVRSGSGDVVVADAVSGDVRLGTGSGSVRVGVHSGVAAELDLSTGSGRARSELDVRHDTPPTAPAVRLSGRTGSGDVLVTRASVAV